MTRSPAHARIALAAAALCATAALAEPETFGSPGRVMVSGAVSLQNVSSDAPAATAVTTLELAPALQIFVARNVALGFQVDFLFATGTGSLTSIGFLPSLGYNFDLAPGISFLPQVRPGFGVTSVSSGAAGATSTTVTRPSVGVYAPFIFRPAGAFFVAFGPQLQQDLSANANQGSAAKETLWGLQTQLGGWF